MDHANAPGGSSDFQQELLAVWQDPQVRSLAVKLAGDPHLAQDVLQAAFCAAARVKHPERIQDPRAYFIKVLKHEAYHLYALRRAVPFENPEEIMDPSQPGTTLCTQAQARPIDETVCTSLQIQAWLKRLVDEHDRLLDTIPARSDDPDLYKATVLAASEQVLCHALNGEASDADSNAALRKAYPAYFDQAGASPDLCYQRFRRAREDVKAVLRDIIRPEDLA